MYQLVAVVQTYLSVNQINWQLDYMKSTEFGHLSTVLDDVI